MSQDAWFLAPAIAAAGLAGLACGIAGVFIITMRIAFVGVCMSHVAFAGALFGAVFGFSPTVSSIAACGAAAGILGPASERADLAPDTTIGILFSTALGASFLLLSLLPGPKSDALALMWGSILTVRAGDVILLAVTAAATSLVAALLHRQVQVTMLSRELAAASGVMPAMVLWLVLFVVGLTVAASLGAVGGLLVFSLIVNPAAAAYQLTYSLKRMFILAGMLGVTSAWLGFLLSWWLDLPVGALITLSSCAVFAAALAFSPKRRARWDRTDG